MRMRRFARHRPDLQEPLHGWRIKDGPREEDFRGHTEQQNAVGKQAPVEAAPLQGAPADNVADLH
jgi:hypothetical protein